VEKFESSYQCCRHIVDVENPDSTYSECQHGPGVVAAEM